MKGGWSGGWAAGRHQNDSRTPDENLRTSNNLVTRMKTHSGNLRHATDVDLVISYTPFNDMPRTKL